MGSQSGSNCDKSGSITGSTEYYCTSYSNYKTYMNIITTINTAYLRYFNHWSLLTEENGATRYELFWACTSKVPQQNICGGVAETYTASSSIPAVMMRNVKFTSTYNGPSLYPN